MKKTCFLPQAALASLANLAAITSLGCGAHTLDVGSTDGGSGGSGGSGSGPGATTYSGGCTPASCANASVSCPGLGSAGGEATPENVQCVPSPNAGQGSEPAGSCILNYTCKVPGVGTSPDGGGCPAWTTPESAAPCPAGVTCASAGATAAGPALGIVTVELDPAANGSVASTTLSAYFTYNVPSNTPQTIGACVFDPEGAARPTGGIVQGSPSPNAGSVSAKGPALSVVASPACDGTYAGATSAETFAGGDVLSFSWNPPTTSSQNPTPFPTTLPLIPAPHVITLGTGLLDAASPAIPRAQDLSLSWTTTGTPMSLEQVFALFTQGKATVTCAFPASAGSGVVPADALLKLAGAPASYEVFSQHAGIASSTGLGWSVSFPVNAVAIATGGLAKGTATLQ
jgi:hypothetical protein